MLSSSKRADVAQANYSQSRAAFLTGLYPHQNGQIGLATGSIGCFSARIPNVVRTLKEAGYRTGIIGKLHVNPESAFPFDYKAIPGANFSRKAMEDIPSLPSSSLSHPKTLLLAGQLSGCP